LLNEVCHLEGAHAVPCCVQGSAAPPTHTHAHAHSHTRMHTCTHACKHTHLSSRSRCWFRYLCLKACRHFKPAACTLGSSASRCSATATCSSPALCSRRARTCGSCICASACTRACASVCAKVCVCVCVHACVSELRCLRAHGQYCDAATLSNTICACDAHANAVVLGAVQGSCTCRCTCAGMGSGAGYPWCSRQAAEARCPAAEPALRHRKH